MYFSYITLTHRRKHSWQFYTQGMSQAARWKKHPLLPILTLVIWNANTCKTTHCWQCLHMSHDEHIGYLTLSSCHTLIHRKNWQLRAWKTSKTIYTARHAESVKGKLFFGAKSTMMVILVWKDSVIVWKAMTIRIYMTPPISKQYDCCCWRWISKFNH